MKVFHDSCMHFPQLSLRLGQGGRVWSLPEVYTADLLQHSGLNLSALRVHSQADQSGNTTEQFSEQQRNTRRHERPASH